MIHTKNTQYQTIPNNKQHKNENTEKQTENYPKYKMEEQPEYRKNKTHKT